MFQSTVAEKNSFATYCRLTWEISKFSLLSAMEYRLNFWIKVFGMFINDLCHVAVWVVFFQRFPQVDGWRLHDTVVLLGVFLTTTSLFVFFAAGTLNLSKNIAEGRLDYYLSFPKHPLWYASVDRTDVWAIADLALGLLLFGWFGHPGALSWLVFAVVVLLAAVILASFNICIQSLAFFLGNYEETADRWFWTVFGFGFYPQNIFGGAIKILTLTFFPAFFLYALPVSLVQHFTAFHMLWLTAFACGSFLLATEMFRRGLRRYESGNLINVRM